MKQATNRILSLKQIQSIFKFSVLACFLSLTLQACEQSGSTNKTKSTIKEVESKPVPAYFVDEATRKVVDYEDLDNAQQWSDPRIQFVHQYPDAEYYAVWSMKADGSDVKLAYTLKYISKQLGSEDRVGRHFNHIPIRSPNNRYLAFTNAENIKVLVDLRTKVLEILEGGAGAPQFNWTADSQDLIFYNNLKLKSYNLETKKITLLSKKIKTDGLYLLKDQKTFLSVLSGVVRYQDKETGKVLKEFDLPIQDIKGSRLSPNEKYLAMRNSYGQSIVDLTTQKTIINVDYYEDSKSLRFGTGIFSPDSKHILSTEEGFLVGDNIYTRGKKKFKKINFYIDKASVINKD